MSAVATIATAPTTATGTTPFRHFSPTLLRRALARHAEWERKEFISSWEDLPVDAYLKGGATFRRRRYSQFHLADGRLVPSGQIVFEQSKEVNSLFGGVQRQFEPLREDVAASALLETVVFTFLDNLPGEIDRSDAAIGVHQIRITASRDEASLPAPEGIHEDGHHFVAQVLINREGVTGASHSCTTATAARSSGPRCSSRSSRSSSTTVGSSTASPASPRPPESPRASAT